MSLLVVLALALLPLGAPAAAADPTPGYTVTSLRVQAKPEVSPPEPVELATELYRTAAPGKVPLVLLAHGFGGSDRDMVPMAQRLASAGYDVAIWTARGFGGSGGQVHLDDPDYEVADVSTIIDRAAQLDNVAQRDGKPVVAVAGVSYGGAVALMAAAQDHRIAAVVPIDTWNDLASAFFPDSVVAGPTGTPIPALRDKATTYGPPWAGPFKQQWVSRFMGAIGAGSGGGSLCGRMVQSICSMFLQASDTGRPSSALLATLRQHSPAPTLGKVTAPVLVVQGVSDSLFGLDQADATVRALTAHHDRVWVRWTTIGHDSPQSADLSGSDLIDPVIDWLNHQLRPRQTTTPPPPGFVYPLPDESGSGSGTPKLYSLPNYPGIARPNAVTYVPVAWQPGQGSQGSGMLSPPGGKPASTLAVPGLIGSAGGSTPAPPVSTYPLAALPGQSVAYDTVRIDHRIVVVGSPQMRIGLGSTTTDATVFVSLWQVNGKTATMPRQLVAPVRVAMPTGAGSRLHVLTVALPPSTYVLPAGSVWRVLITSTDADFANPRDARAYLPAQVLVSHDLALPTVTGAQPVAVSGTTPQWRDKETVGVAIAIVVAAALGAGWLLREHRRQAGAGRATAADASGAVPAAPLQVEGLVKTYRDGHKAVDGVGLRAERGQIVGLLGPNGAGKTTVMRMLMGLIRPDAGTIRVLGETVTPGADVLRHVGALVEGPGFLPHLTGRQNLDAYWAATGRPTQESHLHEVLDVAALGEALDRPVRTYSQGMRQRLGIAEAMLGLPDLLILDEPTNGLDPPQIAAMRPALQAYAEAGRTVLVSSHLLAEVELTCSHVVVMQEGHVVVAGAVADLLSDTGVTRIELDAPTEPGPSAAVEELAGRLRRMARIDEVVVVDHHILDVRARLARGDVVAAAVSAGGRVVGVSAQRHLEEVFMSVIAADDPRTAAGR